MNSSKIRSLYIRKQVLRVCLLILGLWLLAVLLSLLPVVKEYTSQPVADAFSGINALFAGCAFGGVILTIWLQISEVQDTREELQKTAQANLEMAHANVAIAGHAGERSVLDLCYATPLYLTSVVQRLDEVYGFAPLETQRQVWAFFTAHPKVRGYGMDPAYLALAQPAAPVSATAPQTTPAAAG